MTTPRTHANPPDNTGALRSRLAQIPIIETLGFRIDSLGQGEAQMTAPYGSRYDGIFKSFHGGLLMTLADTAACVAVLTLAGVEAVITTTDMGIRFLGPCRSDAQARAKVIKFGRTLCPVSVALFDGDGSPVAIAQVAYIRLTAGTSAAGPIPNLG